MKLIVRHQTLYRYEKGISRAALLLRLMPRNFAGQRVEEWTVELNGVPATGFQPNGYGDMEMLWNRHGHLDSLEIVASGIVETEDRHGVVSGLDERYNPIIFLRETPLTRADEAIRALGRSVAEEGQCELDRLHALCAAVHDAVAYRSGTTDHETTAAEALARGSGVCQDHAHVFISAARSILVPARYVVGYLLAGSGEHALHETHGWVEAFVSGLGWVGFDPSNQVCVTDHYVRLAAGLDAHEAAPVRGSVTGAGEIGIDADVRIAQASNDVEEMQLQRQQQQQQNRYA